MAGRSKPGVVLIVGERYIATVFRIDEKDSFGRPRKLTMIADKEESIDLKAGSREFLVAYVAAHMLAPDTKGKA